MLEGWLDMNELESLKTKVKLLEYHQKLLLGILDNPRREFDRLIIENGLSEADIRRFYQLCDKLSIKLEEQKADGYVYFHPLLEELASSLPKTIPIDKTVKACLTQKLYEPLFQEFEKYI